MLPEITGREWEGAQASVEFMFNQKAQDCTGNDFTVSRICMYDSTGILLPLNAMSTRKNKMQNQINQKMILQSPAMSKFSFCVHCNSFTNLTDN